MVLPLVPVTPTTGNRLDGLPNAAAASQGKDRIVEISGRGAINGDQGRIDALGVDVHGRSVRRGADGRDLYFSGRCIRYLRQ